MPMRILLAGFFLFFLSFARAQPSPDNSFCHCPGMTKAGKGSFYFSYGAHRIFYTRSTIHFKDNETANYDFSLINAKGVDDKNLWYSKDHTAPQFSIRVGYYFNNSSDLGIELNYDHAKYILQQGQKVRVQGTINGVRYNQDTILSPNFVKYEHTDGANFYMVNLLKRMNFLQSKNEKHWLSLVVKPGIGFVLPRTNSRVVGLHRDDSYHVAGYIAGMESGLRYDFLKNFFAELTLKGAYANYNDVLLYKNGRASQDWWSLQTILVAGVQFPAGKK